MNRITLQMARAHINGGRVSEGILNRIEHGIRAYDPCLSCATHAYGRRPYRVLLLSQIYFLHCILTAVSTMKGKELGELASVD